MKTINHPDQPNYIIEKPGPRNYPIYAMFLTTATNLKSRHATANTNLKHC